MTRHFNNNLLHVQRNKLAVIGTTITSHNYLGCRIVTIAGYWRAIYCNRARIRRDAKHMYIGQRWLRLVRILANCCSQCPLRNKQYAIIYFRINFPSDKKSLSYLSLITWPSYLYVGWFCCWFSPYSERFFRVLRFSSLHKNKHFQIPIRLG